MGKVDESLYCSNCGEFGHLAGKCNVTQANAEPRNVTDKGARNVTCPKCALMEARIGELEEQLTEAIHYFDNQVNVTKSYIDETKRLEEELEKHRRANRERVSRHRNARKRVKKSGATA